MKRLCVQCGSELKPQEKFCERCGTPIEQELNSSSKYEPQAHSYVQTNSKSNFTIPTAPPKRSKKKLILTSCLALVLVAGISCGILYVKHITSPANKFAAALENGNYEEASLLYWDELSFDSDHRRQTSDQVISYLNACKEDYLEETMDYDTITAMLEAVSNLGVSGINDEVNSLSDFVEEIKVSRDAYQAAEEANAKADWPTAIQSYCQVSNNDTYYESAQTKLAECTDTYRQSVMDSAKAEVANGDYSSALAQLEASLNVLPEDSQLADLYEIYTAEEQTLYISQRIGEATAFYESGDLAEALNTLSDLLAKYEDVDAQALYDTYFSECLNTALSEGETAFSTGGYSAAVEALDTYKNILRSSDEYQDKISYYRGLQPDRLTQLNIVSGTEWYLASATEPILDTLGNSYSDAMRCYSDDDDETIYYLNGQYTSFSGLLAIYKGQYDGFSGYVEIYGDDTLLYTSPVMTCATEPIDFNVSVTGVKFLKISMHGDNILYTFEPLMANAVLNKY